MTFPKPLVAGTHARDLKRTANKRGQSPPSFFYAEGWFLCLTARYFNDSRMKGSAAWARKYRQKYQSSLFVQLMANFEYFLKDFAGQIVDATNTFDGNVLSADWLEADLGGILSHKGEATTLASLIFHSTQGWTNPKKVNERYGELFGFGAILDDDIPTLNTLWQVRHTLAHNGGFVTRNDAMNAGWKGLEEEVIRVNRNYMESAFHFLAKIVERTAQQMRRKVFNRWFEREALGEWDSDEDAFNRLARLTSFTSSRDKPITTYGKKEYDEFKQKFYLGGAEATVSYDVGDLPGPMGG